MDSCVLERSFIVWLELWWKAEGRERVCVSAAMAMFSRAKGLDSYLKRLKVYLYVSRNIIADEFIV